MSSGHASGEKILLGLIGSGIQRSLSPALHEEEGRQHGVRLHYQLIDLDLSDQGPQALPTLLQAAKVMGYAGLNITYPCKQAVIALLDELSEEAALMGAVNTVVIRDGRCVGHNTDGVGWASGFARALPQADLSRVVLLGAGGAGAAVAHAALRLGVENLQVFDRDTGKMEALAADLQRVYGMTRVTANADVRPGLQRATGLIHATPTGMDKKPGLPLDADLLHPGLWVSEIVYFPLETALLKVARARGCAVSDGGGMAVGQAVGAFERFTGLKADPLRMESHFRRMVSQLGERVQRSPLSEASV